MVVELAQVLVKVVVIGFARWRRMGGMWSAVTRLETFRRELRFVAPTTLRALLS
jgi:hypothetical protein